MNDWKSWNGPFEAYAPIVAMHKLHPYRPMEVAAFFADPCDLRIPPTAAAMIPEHEFAAIPLKDLSFIEKMQLLNHPRLNRRGSYLSRFNADIDPQQSILDQDAFDTTIYVRGFKNEQTGEAYLNYWMFFLENFVPTKEHDVDIEKSIDDRLEDLCSHQGDWEGVSIRFDDADAADPTWIYVSQHGKVCGRRWDDNSVLKSGTHARILTAIGTHANFFKPVRRRNQHIYWEVAQRDREYFPEAIAGRRIRKYKLHVLDVNTDLWLGFRGRWGKSLWGIAGQAPTGPLMKDWPHFSEPDGATWGAAPPDCD